MTAATSIDATDRHGPVPTGSILAAQAADAKLGERTVVLAVADVLGITDAFVVTSGHNARQVRTIVDEVERQLKTGEGRAPASVEGLDDARWVLMDYGDFLVHVFDDEARDYYDLEHLWSQAPRVAWAEEATRPQPAQRSSTVGR